MRRHALVVSGGARLGSAPFQLLSQSIVAAMFLLAAASAHALEKDEAPLPSDPALGRALFLHAWLPHDSRSPNGDGLGPMFNARSCVACHSKGGVGGAGERTSNVSVISATISKTTALSANVCNPLVSTVLDNSATPAEAAEAHPALLQSSSTVLHKFAVREGYDAWRTARLDNSVVEVTSVCRGSQSRSRNSKADLFARDGNVEDAFAELRAARTQIVGIIPENRRTPRRPTTVIELNPPSLFGLGLIDAIPDRVLEAAAKKRPGKFASVQGRLSVLSDGRIGRFGWKAQTATLYDFAMQACATEIGLEVPGHSQSPDPREPQRIASGLDLAAYECDSLVAFVRSLPTPEPPASHENTAAITKGRRLFVTTGCADCHRPDLGKVKGLYSDLLLHDMGSLGRSGGYASVVRQFTVGADKSARKGNRPTVETVSSEWRTPPLWGCADSAPYFHDGSAPTLRRAIALHDGEASASGNEFEKLPKASQDTLIEFLGTLRAPLAAEQAPEPPSNDLALVR